MVNMQKAKRIHNPFLLLQQKKTKRGKECAALACFSIFYDSGYLHTFFKFPSLRSEISC